MFKYQNFEPVNCVCHWHFVIM